MNNKYTITCANVYTTFFYLKGLLQTYYSFLNTYTTSLAKQTNQEKDEHARVDEVEMELLVLGTSIAAPHLYVHLVGSWIHGDGYRSGLRPPLE
jgi:hypothetical protein